MSQLIEALYPLPDVRRTPMSLLRWWESKRLFYNKVVGAAGLVTLAGFSILSILPPYSSGIEPMGMLFAVAVYGVVANGCYSLGWLLELAARRIWGRQAPDVGPLLFRQGLIFSVGLTLLPLVPMTLLYVARVVAAIVS